MAIKKGLFQDYAKHQDIERQKRVDRAKKSKYTHAKVFDNDENTFIENNIELEAINDKMQIEPLNQDELRLQSPLQKKINKPRIIKKIEVKELSDKLDTKKKDIDYSERDINKSLFNLQGYQKQLFVGLLHKTSALETNIVEKITINELMTITNSTNLNTKLAISRLVDKGLLIRYKGKTAKHGYYNLGFNDQVIKIAKDIFLNLNKDIRLNNHFNNAKMEIIN